jgi:hypothetical protein
LGERCKREERQELMNEDENNSFEVYAEARQLDLTGKKPLEIPLQLKRALRKTLFPVCKRRDNCIPATVIVVMKKILYYLIIPFVMAACNNDKETVESAPNTPNVQNVNGNMPDTGSSISLDNSQSQDSTRTGDSLQR